MVILLAVSIAINVVAFVFFLASLKMWSMAKAGVTPQMYMAEKPPKPSAQHPLEPSFPSREEMSTTHEKLRKAQQMMCHDKRCPGRRTLRHRCHNLDCKEHPQRTTAS